MLLAGENAKHNAEMSLYNLMLTENTHQMAA